jgi:hypothetical protein
MWDLEEVTDVGCLVVVYEEGTNSWGSAMETGVAYLTRIPIVISYDIPLEEAATIDCPASLSAVGTRFCKDCAIVAAVEE